MDLREEATPLARAAERPTTFKSHLYATGGGHSSPQQRSFSWQQTETIPGNHSWTEHGEPQTAGSSALVDTQKSWIQGSGSSEEERPERLRAGMPGSLLRDGLFWKWLQTQSWSNSRLNGHGNTDGVGSLAGPSLDKDYRQLFTSERGISLSQGQDPLLVVQCRLVRLKITYKLPMKADSVCMYMCMFFAYTCKHLYIIK